MRFRLSHQALQDIEEIRAFTVERWGRAQWVSYFAGLSEAFERIAADPTCGLPRYSMRGGMRSLVYRKHLIFFEAPAAPGQRVSILRIAHERRNLAALSYHDKYSG
jgi:toxin ParE1/3/4